MSRRAFSLGPGGALLGLLLLGSAEAGTFRFVDASGVVHYTNIPSDPRYPVAPVWNDPAPAASRMPPRSPLRRFAEAIHAAAERYGVDRRLVEAVIVVESGGNPGAVSPKGATGLMQLMPHRAAQLGVLNPFDPQQNLDGGVRHLRDLLERFEGDLTLALAAYNAGEEAVRSYRGVPPYRETQEYVKKIRALYGNVVPSVGDRERPATPDPGRIYEQVAEDGTVVYTNLPPEPATRLPRF
jgi:soluble lytic murein transglycosylase-like protein